MRPHFFSSLCPEHATALLVTEEVGVQGDKSSSRDLPTLPRSNLLFHVVTLYALGIHTATAFPFSLRRRSAPFLISFLLPLCGGYCPFCHNKLLFLRRKLQFILPSFASSLRSFVPSESNSAAAVPENWGPSLRSRLARPTTATASAFPSSDQDARDYTAPFGLRSRRGRPPARTEKLDG